MKRIFFFVFAGVLVVCMILTMAHADEHGTAAQARLMVEKAVEYAKANGKDKAIAELNNHGSLFATRPKLNDYIGTRSELLEGADTLFAAVINGKLHVPINHAYALKDAAKAHTDLEGRGTTGASILKP